RTATSAATATPASGSTPASALEMLRPGPAPATAMAMPASARLRSRADGPTGAECSLPKQLQSGCSPRASARVMAAENTTSVAAAASAPQRAVTVGNSRTAVVSSTTGSAIAPGPARLDGRPNSTRVARVPFRSASLATLATAKIAASPIRAMRKVTSKFGNPNPRGDATRRGIASPSVLGKSPAWPGPQGKAPNVVRRCHRSCLALAPRIARAAPGAPAPREAAAGTYQSLRIPAPPAGFEPAVVGLDVGLRNADFGPR